MDARALNFTDQSFDAALFSANGLDHVPGYSEKLEVLRRVFRVLRPGAPFIFSVHRIWSPVHMPRLIAGGLKVSLGKIMGLNTLEKEWGELYDLNAATLEEGYGQFLTSGKWRMALKTAGFDFVFCQSRYRLESHRTLGWIRRSLSSANFMFYVVRKPH
jgi:SAM-dependent methyltransferase